MARKRDEVADAVQVFMAGFCVGKSRTHPYEPHQVERLWVMRDAPRRNPRDYRNEEWVAYGVAPRVADATARRQARGKFVICAILKFDEPQGPLREEFKQLGYRLVAAEPMFLHRLQRIPRKTAPVRIQAIRSAKLADQFAKITRSRPLSADCLANQTLFRQYVARDGSDIVGWVRSVDAAESTWYADLFVRESHRRRGIGSAMLAILLRDDRARGSKSAVLTSSRAGTLLYPQLGFDQIGTLFLFSPRRIGTAGRG